ncbi:MAG: hypothetical protein V1747_11080 [Candidatus Omnitrophota bacterium]
MKIFWFMLIMVSLILGIASLLMPLLPVWAGGLIGIGVFLLVGSLAAKFCV